MLRATFVILKRNVEILPTFREDILEVRLTRPACRTRCIQEVPSRISRQIQQDLSRDTRHIQQVLSRDTRNTRHTQQVLSRGTRHIPQNRVTPIVKPTISLNAHRRLLTKPAVQQVRNSIK